MITVRPSKERGYANYGWLETHHTFSFGDYMDPAHMGFRQLRVINEDSIAPGQGFGTHPHRDMEIITYVLEGALEHKDSMGNSSVIRPGDVQRMSAGTGVTHSEANHSKTETTHLLQIWILPRSRGIEPSYEQRTFTVEERRRTLRLVADGGARDGAVRLHQDASVYASILEPGERVEHSRAPDRYAWLQIARGGVTLNGIALEAGDGAAVSSEPRLSIAATASSEILLFDLP